MRYSTRPTILCFLGLVSALLATSLSAATLQVDDDSMDCGGAGFTSIAAALAAANATGDTIEICDGTYAEGTLEVTKEVVIDGLNRDTTVISLGAGEFGFHVRADNVTISDLTFEGNSAAGANGLRLEEPAPMDSVDNTIVSNVVFRNFDDSGRGIEVHLGTFNDLQVLNSMFSEYTYGMRFGSATQVDGFTLTGSSFTLATNSNDFSRIGVYQANDSGTSTFRDFQASNNTFTNHALAGIYVEEIADSTISSNEFTGDYTGIIVFKAYATSGVAVSGLQITGNTFTDATGRAVFLQSTPMGLGAGVEISGNMIDFDASALSGNRGAISAFLNSAQVHETLTIAQNEFILTDAMAGGATTTWAIHLSGDGPVLIDRNDLDGGGFASTGGMPPVAGVYIQSRSGTHGDREDSVTINCNTLTGFEHGVTVYDGVGGAGGNLPNGTLVQLGRNDIVGNSAFGVFNGASPGSSWVINADDNYWGDLTGPSGAGPGTGDAVGENISTPTWRIVAQELCTIPVELFGFSID